MNPDSEQEDLRERSQLCLFFIGATAKLWRAPLETGKSTVKAGDFVASKIVAKGAWF